MCACHDPAVWGHQPPCPAADTRPQVYRHSNWRAPGNPWAPIPMIDGRLIVLSWTPPDAT